MGFDLRTKKRILEAKEELKESKKPKKDDIKETKELKKVKKGEIRDLKTKIRDDSKEIRKTKKEKCVESQVDSDLGVLSDSPLQEEDCEDFQVDNREEKQKFPGVAMPFLPFSPPSLRGLPSCQLTPGHCVR